MKRNLNRSISLLLTVCLVLGIFAGSGITLVRAENVEDPVETVDVSAPNLIANGTFGEARDINVYPNNASIPEWGQTNIKKFGTVQVTDAFAKEGTYSLHVAGPHGAQANLCLDRDITADEKGKDLTISVWVRGIVTAEGARYGVEFRNYNAPDPSTGKEYTVVKIDNKATVVNIPRGTYSEWTQFFVTYAIPEATWVRIKPIEVTDKTDADLYIDCASVLLDGQELLTNGSFENMTGFESKLVQDYLLKDIAGWVPGGTTGNNPSGTVTVVADPTDATNAVLALNDTSAQPVDENGDPIPKEYNEDGSVKKYEEGKYVTAHFGGFDVAPGKYNFSLKYKVADVEDAQTLAVNLRGNGYSSPTATNGIIALGTKTTKASTTTEWQTLEIPDVTITEESKTFFVMLNTGKNQTGIVYVDDVTLTKVCEHTFGDEVVSGEGTCASPIVSVKTCTLCGAAETTTTTFDHAWVNGVCSACELACEHNAPEGYCTICSMELPADKIENELIDMGALQVGGEVATNYCVNESWQIAPWYFGGSYKTEGISVKFTNEWSSDGDWSLYLEDSNNAQAVSINFVIDLPADAAGKEMFISADVAGAVAGAQFYAQPYANGEAMTTVDAAGKESTITLGTGQFFNAGSKSGTGTISRTHTIPEGADQLYVKLTTGKYDELCKAFVDNLILTVDNGENLIPNASFETLPVGVEPVESAATIPAISYPKGSKEAGKEKNGWYGLADKVVENEIVEEMIMIDRDGEQTGVLHIKDTRVKADPTPNTTVVYYDLYNLEKNTTYTLTFKAKKTGDTPQVAVTQNGADENAIAYNPFAAAKGQLHPKFYLKAEEWTECTITFTTAPEEYDLWRVRIGFSTASDTVAEAWFDDISLTKDCAHTWENPVVSEANCANASYRTVTCACGAIGVTEVAPCNENHVLVEATCTTPSYCSVPGCGYIDAEALGHDCSNAALEAGATAPCTRCGVEVGHKWADEEGVISGTCNRCDTSCAHVYDNDCDADCNTCGATRDAGHDYDDNCDVDCNVCGDFRTAPHNLGESVPAVIPANCQETGHDEYWICADCDAYFLSDGNGGYYETNPAWINYTGEHTRPEGIPACAVVACIKCGEDSYGTEPCDRGDAPACQDATCVNCGEIVWGEGHSYGYSEDGWTPLIPFCQAGVCIHCGEHLDYIYECENGSYAPCSVDGECVHGCGKLFPATSIHGLDDPCAGGLCWMCWEEIEGAHNYVDGACSNCGAEDPNAGPEEDEELPDIGCGDNHSWNEGEVTVAAGKNTTGIMTYTCTACGEQKEEVIPPVLRFNGATLTLMSNVQVNFTVSRAILDEYGYTDLYAVFTYTNRDKQLITVTVTEYRLTDKYVFDFTELAPDLFGNTITATLYAKNNGKEYVSKTIEYSVLTYCNNKLEVYAAAVQKADLCFRTMLVDLLNYGAAAQLESGNNTDALVNAGLTEEQKSWGSTASGGYVSIQGAGEEVETPRATWKSASLLLEDAVTMVVTLEAADLEGLSVKVNCGKFEFTYDCVVDPEAEEQIFVPGEKENRYKLYINELPVYAMRDPVYITVYKDGEAASRQLTYSVESYVANKYGKVSESFDNMLDAMMRYGDAVNAYVTALGVK